MANLADPRRLWADGSAIDVHGVTVTRLTAGPSPSVPATGGDAVVEVVGVASETTLVRMDTPLHGATGFWHPAAGWERHLAADWMATGRRTVGLVDSTPLGCLYDDAGRAVLGFATDRLVRTTRLRFGVGERTGRFGVWLAMDLGPGELCRIRIALPGAAVAETVRSLARWQSGAAALPAPEAGRLPAYSTWYSYHQEVSAAAIEAEAELAAGLGCGLLILDDGWQRGAYGGGYAGCGDWEPDLEKFPDFGAHVETVHGLGMKYLAWIAPLLLGDDSAARDRLAAFAPHARPEWRCHVLDPRHEEVRRFVVDTCVRLVDRYGLDGLKIDFLDAAMVYAEDGPRREAGIGSGEVSRPDDGAGPEGDARLDDDTGLGSDARLGGRAHPEEGAGSEDGAALGGDTRPEGGARPEGSDHPEKRDRPDKSVDVGEAMWALLAELRDKLRAVRGADLMIELRQPYAGPAMLQFGNLLRAGDCPADAVGNRVRTLDLSAVGRESAVHSDMLMWDPQASPQVAARQLLSVLHAVPQISMPLAHLPAAHRAMAGFWLAFWREHRDVLTRGALDAGRPDELHPVVIARDATRAVVVYHAGNHAATLDPSPFDEIAVVNNTGAERVLLDLTHPAAVRLDVRDACGTSVRSETARLEPGPRWLAVPPSGLCLIRPA
ncbi:alpha-galactosidase [Nonomuraea sp. NPDC005650]|uniref:alpha-galactosidase n=1 Tax=Nonomuraea sp. NPDC005650 TaxID=3157045 RepID=UPI0033A6450B